MFLPFVVGFVAGSKTFPTRNNQPSETSINVAWDFPYLSSDQGLLFTRALLCFCDVGLDDDVVRDLRHLQGLAFSAQICDNARSDGTLHSGCLKLYPTQGSEGPDESSVS